MLRYEWRRELSELDMRQMIDLMNTVAVKETTLGFQDPLGEADGMALMQAFAADLHAGAVELLAVSSDDDGIVGMVTLARSSLPARRHIVEMRRCVVHPAHRGTFLLDGWAQAIGKVGAMGCDMITLEVRDDGPEVLWRRLGFRSYGLLPDYARIDGRSIPGHFMYAPLPEILEHKHATDSWLFAAAPASG